MRRTLLGALAIGCLSTALAAQPAPLDPAADNANPAQRRVPSRMERGAYLGVSTSPAPQVLRQQLGLPRGVGLVIDSVAPGSPAEAAGVKAMDVLHKLNDQVLINQQQLAVLVRTFKGGQSVALTVFRDGKSTELTAKLEERDVPPLEQMRLFNGNVFDPFDQHHLEGVPDLPDMNIPPRVDPNRPFPPGRLMNQNFSIAWDDGKIQMSLTMQDGKKHLIAHDHSGKELYNGPIDTEEQQQKLPPEVRERLPKVGPPGMFKPTPPAEENKKSEKSQPNPDQDRPATKPSQGQTRLPEDFEF